jgi:hypothetical protein
MLFYQQQTNSKRVKQAKTAKMEKKEFLATKDRLAIQERYFIMID